MQNAIDVDIGPLFFAYLVGFGVLIVVMRLKAGMNVLNPYSIMNIPAMIDRYPLSCDVSRNMEPIRPARAPHTVYETSLLALYNECCFTLSILDSFGPLVEYAITKPPHIPTQ